MGCVYQAYFRRLEVELEAVLEKPDLCKLLEMFVAIETDFPLQFIPRALGVDLDCRQTKRLLKVTLYEKMLKLPILRFLSIFTN